MNILLGFFQLITIVIICIYEYNQRSVAIFLWGTLLIMFGIPHILGIIINTNDYSQLIIIKASIFAILFNLMYIFLRYTTNRIRRINTSFDFGYRINEQNKELNKVDYKLSKIIKSFLFMMLTISLLILVYTVYKNLGSVMYSTWGGLRSIRRQQGLFSILRFANYFFFSSAGISLVFILERRYKLFGISILIIVMYSMIVGNRLTFLPALIAFVVPLLFNKTSKLSIKQIITASSLAFVSVYTVYVLIVIRHNGGFFSIMHNLDISDINNSVFNMILNGDGELGLRRAFYYFIKYDNNFANFNKAHTYIRMLLIGIPTSFSGGIKPPDFAISMGSAWIMNPYNTTFSMHPTLYGDCFANLGWFGIFLGFFWAIFINMIDLIIKRKNHVMRIMLFAIYSVSLVIVARGSVYNAVFSAFVNTIIIYFVYIISKLISKIKV